MNTGDVNADPGNPAYSGYGDLLINASNAQSGMSIGYLVFGGADILGDPRDPAAGPYSGTVSAGGIGTISNNQGSINLNVLTESGAASKENVGLGSFNAGVDASGNVIGDGNGDGINDILLGGRGAGSGYLTWGKAYLQDISNFQLNRLANDQGFLLSDLATPTQGSLHSVGDFNGDGYDDFLSITPGQQFSEVRLELGGSSEAILADYLYNDVVFTVVHGTQVIAAGDVNADGLSDIALFLPENVSTASEGNQGEGSSTGILLGRPSETLHLGSGFVLLAPNGLTLTAQDVQYGLSDAAPCFLAVGETIYAVVKSYDDNSLWFSRSADGGSSWQSWVDIIAGQNSLSSALPVSLAFYDGKLWLAFSDSAQGISLASWDHATSQPSQWSTAVQIQPPASSSLAPLLLNQGDVLALYWVDAATGAITTASSTTPATAADWSAAAPLSVDASGTPLLSDTALAWPPPARAWRSPTRMPPIRSW